MRASTWPRRHPPLDAGSETPDVAWHSISAADAQRTLGSDGERGLRSDQAKERMVRWGPNTIPSARAERWWEEAFETLTEPLILLLIGVAVLYGILGKLEDAITILGVILAVAAVEVLNDGRAKRAIASLTILSNPWTTVVRDAQLRRIPSQELVPGDVVLLEPGIRVPADLRLLETAALRADESALTGESAAIHKRAEIILPKETELADRANLGFAGTLVVTGKGKGVVIATGPRTAAGSIASLSRTVKEPRTPLQQHMRELSGWLLWLALGFSALIPILGVLVAGQPWQQMLLTGLTLAFATIPEELPILITIILGLGAYRLARRNAIVKRLRATETLGSVTVVGTDKTGTLTENRLRVAELVGADAQRLLEIAVLASDAQAAETPSGVQFAGDPTETALLAAAQEAGIQPIALRRCRPAVLEFPFDETLQRMSAICEDNRERRLVVKGSPEAVLDLCTVGLRDGKDEPLDGQRRAQLLAVAAKMAAQGLRVLAFADRALAGPQAGEARRAEIEQGLRFAGFIGLSDPPRAEARQAITELAAAGVRVMMLTGDHPATAVAIARQTGIDARSAVLGRELESLSGPALLDAARRCSVFARITPEHKLRIVRALQDAGEVMAVTGDGVNDGPALREAAVGVAMGRTGSDVAREAADLVLGDDNLSTITAAVSAARGLYANLRKAVRYYLAVKIALVTALLIAVLAGLAVPFQPVQIIVLELFMDLGASTAFVAEAPEGDLMRQPPRDPKRPFMDRPIQLGIAAGGLTLAASVLIPYTWLVHVGYAISSAQSAAFVAWMIGHVALAAQMRSEREPLSRRSLISNPPYLIWAAAAIVLAVAGTTMPLLQARLHLAPLPLLAWGLAIAPALLLPWWWDALKRLRSKQGHTVISPDHHRPRPRRA